MPTHPPIVCTDNRPSLAAGRSRGSRARAESSTTVVASNGHRKRDRDTATMKDLLQNIHPHDYIQAAFAAAATTHDGLSKTDLIASINHASVARFLTKPTATMIAEYSTEIVRAVRANDVATARRLYQEGKFTSNACNRFGESILHIACRRGHLGMVQFLLEDVGLNVHDLRDDYQRTVLHDAFWTPQAAYDVVDYLLQQPYAVDLLLLPDQRGFTPVHYARADDRGKWLHFFWERKALLQRTTTMVSSPTTATTSSSSRNVAVTGSITVSDNDEELPHKAKQQRVCSSVPASSEDASTHNIVRIVSTGEITQLLQSEHLQV